MASHALPYKTSARRTRSTTQMWVLVAFVAVYIFWGSTYLAMRFAIETLPPFLMAAIRFSLAGAVMYIWARLRGAARPTAKHLRTAVITGGLLLLGGNGVVVWAEQFVPSSLAALLIATVPLWLVVIDSVVRRKLPALPVAAGVGLGLAGIAVLIGPQAFTGGGGQAALLGAVAIVLASLSWALGTFYSRRASQPDSQVMSTALNLLAGGMLLAIFGGMNGELARLNFAEVSLKSWMALAFLIVFGSWIGFSAYLWLVKVTNPTKAASNFYVNPVVAVLLGWALGGEPLSPRFLLATLIIVGAVILIVSAQGRQARRASG